MRDDVLVHPLPRASLPRFCLLVLALALAGCASAPHRSSEKADDGSAASPDAAMEEAPAEETAVASGADEGGLDPVPLESLSILRTDASDATVVGRYRTNPTWDARARPTSRVVPSAARAAVDFARAALADGHLPAPALARAEDFVHAFTPADDDGGASVRVHVAPSPFRRGYHGVLVRFAAGGAPAAPPRPPVTVLVDVSGRDDPSLARARAFVSALDERATVRTLAFGRGGPARAALAAGAAPHLAHALPRAAGGRVVVLVRGGLRLEDLAPALAGGALTGAVDVVGLPGARLRDDAASALASATGGRYRVATSDADARALADELALGPPAVRDLALSVRFDPDVVERYRLLGYPALASAADVTRDPRGTTLFAGEQVAVLYEVKLRRARGDGGEVVATWAGGESRRTLTFPPPSARDAAADDPVARQALAAAALAAKLGDDYWARAYDYDAVLRALGDLPPSQERRALRDLTTRARALDERPTGAPPRDLDRVPDGGAP